MATSYSVRNPRSGTVDYWFTLPTIEQLSSQCGRLREAQRHWQQVGLTQRIQTLQQWQQAVLSQREALTSALVADTGRYAISLLEIDSVLATIDRWCRLSPELLQDGIEKSTGISFIRLQQQLVPYALVGVISPWNFPLLLSVIDAIPALLAGCAVIVKPSEITPRFIEPLMATIASVPLLQDVLQYITGTGETGAALIEQVDLVCFTGSVRTGQIVAQAAARQFIPVFLELGGKDPAIVLASADVELATSAVLWGAIVNTGQSCLSIERIYIAEPIFDAFVEQLIAKAKQVQLAYPTVESGDIGPIIAEFQAQIITKHLADAKAKGAMIHCGGAISELEGGLWCRPTVLTQVDHSMTVMTEETFGPIMPVMPFSTVEEAVQLANSSNYGLSAAVFAGTTAEAIDVARQLEVGAISINDAGLTSFIHEGEKQSFKLSGLGGSRMGLAALSRFLRKKVFLIKTEGTADPWWFA